MNGFKFNFRITLFGVWLLALAPFGTNSRAEDALAAGTEPLVLLTNGNVLRGAAEVEGDIVILHRADGNNLRLRREQVLYTAATVEELYRYRSQKRSSHNAASHIDDAKWCLRYGLLEGAEAEVSKLMTLDPSHPDVSRLQRQIAAAKTPHAKAPLVLPIVPPEPEVRRAESAPMPEGISPTSIAAFASKVQPLLINRCGNAGCHRTGSDRTLQLSHLGVNVRVSARMTQRNLIAVLRQVNMEDPFSSELLKYSKTSHGNEGYIPAGHTAQSVETTLRDWLSQLGRYPQPLIENSIIGLNTNRPISSTPTKPSPWPVVQAASSEPIPEDFTIDQSGELIYDPTNESGDELEAAPVIADLVPPGWPAPVIGPIQHLKANKKTTPPASLTPTADTVHPKRLPTIDNPFSADIFNRQYQHFSANSLPK